MRGFSLTRFRENRRGAVSVVTAVFLTVALILCALAVDTGSVFLQTRRLQGVADLAAISAANDMARAQVAAEATVAANNQGWRTPLKVAVTKGRYTADSAIPVAQRFQATDVDSDAARVSVSGEADLFFGAAVLGRPSLPIRRKATAARADLASFSIGSRLASLNGGVVNALLSGLTGSQINLSVMDYNSLIDADVSLFSYLDALKLRLHLTAATYDDVLKADLTTGQALSALADVLTAAGKTQAATAARSLSVSVGNGQKAYLEALVSVGPYGDQDHVSGGQSALVSLSAMDLAQAVLQVGRGGRQVKLDLGASLPGVAETNVWLAIGEPPNGSPYMTITRDKSVIVRTAQTRLYIDVKLLGSGVLSGVANIHVPLLVELASGEAKLKAIDCGLKSTTLDVKPSVGALKIGDINVAALDDFKRPLTVTPTTLVQVLVVKVTAMSDVTLGGATWQPVNFTDADIRGRKVKTVKTNDLLTATVASLLASLKLDVSVLGLNLGLGDTAILAALRPLLTAVAAPLDGLVNTLTSLLGLGLGEADVRVNGLRCGVAALVA
jgi:uncharacterized membrane protein